MPKYEVLLSKAARKAIDKLPLKTANTILAHITSLSENPRPTGCKKLKGYAEAWRIRSGDYRIIYEIEDKILKILVIAVGHRKDVYD
jgi:mRNA interferase RelE/StbE